MKRIRRLSIALVMSIVTLTLMTPDLGANAAPPRRYVADTGMVTLGPNQMLRLTVLPPRDKTVFIEYLLLGTVQTGCESGVCMHTVTSRTESGPVTVRPGQVSSYDILLPPNSSAVQGMVRGDNADIRVNALLIDIPTGAIQNNTVLVMTVNPFAGQ
jgi:hypothetical protein